MQISTAINTPLTPIMRGIVGLSAYSPSLLLDFTSGNQSLDPRITFSRASNATVTKSDGTIGYAPHNLLTYSEQFDNAAWAKTRASVIANTIVAPDGALTGDKFVEDTTASATHNMAQSVSFTSGTAYTFSFYAKQGERTVVRAQLPSAAFGANVSYNFDLIAGTATLVGAGTGNSASILPVGNGWYRCIVTAQATATASGSVAVFFVVSNTITYTGDGYSGIYIWGAQLNVGALQPYYPTTVKNLLGYTQEFDNAAWNKGASSVVANAIAAPDGTLTGDKLIEDTTTGGHYVFQNLSGATSSSTYTASVFLKAAERGFAIFRTEGSWGVNAVTVNLSTGATASGTGTVTNVVSTNVGNGWWRVSFAFTAAATSGAVSVMASTDGVYANRNYTGNGTSGIYIWGAQLSDSASLDQYVYNPGAAPTAAAYYGPRFDYDPVTLAPKGLLIEEQRTNLLTYSEQFDNAVWGKTRSSITSDAATSPDGTVDADELVEDTTASSTHDLTVTYTFTSGNAYTFSFYAKSNGRNVRLYFPFSIFGTSYSTVFNLEDGTASAAVTGSVFEIKPVGNGWYRCSMTQTATASATSGFTVRLIQGASTISYTGDGYSGIYIWGAQLEAGAFPTSYIPTTSAQVTRAADSAVMTGANFSNWYNQMAGTLLVDAIEKPDTVTRIFSSISDGTTEAYATATFSNTGRIRAQNVSSGGIGTTITGQPFKIGYSFESGAQSGSLNGSAIVTTTTTVTVVPTMLRIGCNQTATAFWNSTIRRIAYYPRRLSNTEIVAITS